MARPLSPAARITLIALAWVLQAVQWALLWHWRDALGPALAIAVAGAVPIAVLLWRSLPGPLLAPAGAMLAWFALTNALVPGLGPALRGAIAAGWHWRRLRIDAPTSAVEEPEYSVYRASASARSRSGRLRTKLTNLKVPVAERLTALLAIQDAPARVTSDILKLLLADPAEDVRLLSYGMIDAKEKAIGSRILAEEARLDRVEDDAERYGVCKRLAELQWELVWQRLVQGDMRSYACSQAQKYAQMALALRPDDAGLWFLEARVGLEVRDAATAARGLSNAERLGFPREQLVPYLAELAFLERRFADVPALWAELPVAPGSIRLAASYRYWTA